MYENNINTSQTTQSELKFKLKLNTTNNRYIINSTIRFK